MWSHRRVWPVIAAPVYLLHNRGCDLFGVDAHGAFVGTMAHRQVLMWSKGRQFPIAVLTNYRIKNSTRGPAIPIITTYTRTKPSVRIYIPSKIPRRPYLHHIISYTYVYPETMIFAFLPRFRPGVERVVWPGRFPAARCGLPGSATFGR